MAAKGQPSLRVTCQANTTIALEDLEPLQGDLKALDKESFAKLRNSILTHGISFPFFIWRDKKKTYCLDGHQRDLVLRRLQAEGYKIPPLPADPIQAKNKAEAKEKLLLASSRYGRTTERGLAGFLEDINANFDQLTQRIQLPEIDIAKFFARHAGAGIEEIDAPEPPANPITKPGDLWELDNHRLLCGDATSLDSLKRLMGREQASLIFTDPPYGISYVASSGNHKAIAGDDLRGDTLAKLLIKALKAATRVADDTAAFYVWYASTTTADFAYALKAAGLVELQQIVWAKPVPVLGRADYQWSHELCFYAAKDGSRPAFYGDRTQPTIWRTTIRTGDGATAVTLEPGLVLTDGKGTKLFLSTRDPKRRHRVIRVEEGQPLDLVGNIPGSTIWEVRRDAANPEHPTQKPVELARRAIENSSRPGEIILDIFLGSGTTLIGAEQLGRRCYGIDIEPGYLDVAIGRYLKLKPEARIQKAGKPINPATFLPEQPQKATGHRAQA